MTRCACGYGPEWHPLPLRHCPLCACGKLPAEHVPVMTPPSPLAYCGLVGAVAYPPSPLVAFADYGQVFVHEPVKVEHVCPGKPRTAAGHLPHLRRGSWREPPPNPRYATRPEWGAVLFVVDEPAAVEDDDVQPPRVPARYTVTLDEIAPRAMSVGKQAAARGWAVEPFYAVDHEGAELSYLLLRRDELTIEAMWRRPAGGKWATAGCRGWPRGGARYHFGVKRLGELIIELG